MAQTRMTTQPHPVTSELHQSNTDKEIWRERPDDYYADSIFVTVHGNIGFDCGGTVFVRSIRDWHAAMAERNQVDDRVQMNRDYVAAFERLQAANYQLIREKEELRAELNRRTPPAACPSDWVCVPREPTPEIIAAAAKAVWPVPSKSDLELATQAVALVLKDMKPASPMSTTAIAEMISTMAPAYRAMIGAADSNLSNFPCEAAAWAVSRHDEIAYLLFDSKERAHATAALLENVQVTPLYAAPPPPAAAEGKGEWLPIESAPKDGTEVLLYREDAGVMLGRYTNLDSFLTESELEKYTEDECLSMDWFYADFVCGDRLEGPELPTHWQPLPPAPGMPE